MPLLDDIPEYKQVKQAYDDAVASEAFDRLASYLDVPEKICGIEVQSLTPRLVIELDAINSPFFCGEFPEPGDVGVFLWHLSTRRLAPCPWHYSRKSWTRKNRDDLLREIAALDFFEVTGKIFAYIREAFEDGPGEDDSEAAPIASWASSIVDLLAGQYGWAEQQILDIPYKRIWQYWRRCETRRTEGKAYFNNVRSGKIRSDWLDTYIPK